MPFLKYSTNKSEFTESDLTFTTESDIFIHY